MKIEHLKSKEEYLQELKEIHEELGVGIATNTLIKSDLKLLQRIDEILVLISFIESGKHKVSK